MNRLFYGGEDEEETAVYSPEEVGMKEPEKSEEEPQGFTVEKAAEVIRNLPPEVPRRSAVRIVRQTLSAAGIDIEDLGSSTRGREEKLNSEVEQSQQRIQELKDKTEEVLSSLQEEMSKAREARNAGIAREERKISRAHSNLESVQMVRDFFGVSGEGVSPADTSGRQDVPAGDDTQVMERSDEDDTRVMRRGPLSDDPEPRDR